MQVAESDYDIVKEFYTKYKELFTIKRVSNPSTKKSEIKVSLNENKLDLLKEFLNETIIPIISTTDIIEFSNKVIPGVTYDDVKEITQQITNIYNKHHNYLDKIGSFNKLFRIMNNYNQHQLLKIIQDPVNQVAAQVSVDEIVNPIQKIAKTRGASIARNNAKRQLGNSIGKFESINDTQEGADCIAKGASSMKSFFAAYHASNQILNFKGDLRLAQQTYNNLPKNVRSETSVEEILERQIILRQQTLVKKNKKGDIDFLLANIKAQDISTVKSEDVLDALNAIETNQDAINYLSALLGLSADNAKELVLSKINAGIDMIGLYLYGIIAGNSFEEISRALMSDTGRTVRKICQGNIFKEDLGYRKLSQVFLYFTRDGYNKILDINSEAKSVFLDLLKKRGVEDLFKLINDSNVTVLDILNLFDSMKEEVRPDQILTLKLISDMEQYVIDYKDTDNKTLKFLKNLAFGAEEMQKLGQMILNKELPTSEEDIIKKVNLIESVIEDSVKAYEKFNNLSFDEKNALNSKLTSIKSDPIKLSKLFMAPGEIERRAQQLDEFKHSVNILAILNQDPHFKGYLKELSILDESFYNSSFRYRSIRNLVPQIKNHMYMDDKVLLRKLSQFVQKYMINDWLFTSKKSFILPKGNKFFDPNSNLLSEEGLSYDQEFMLGTDAANNTFRRWMEIEVIPALQRGDLGNMEGINEVAKNKFISTLEPSKRTNTVLGNVSLIYSLKNVNMTPKKGSVDEKTLDTFKADYNKLSNFEYVKAGKSYNLKDLFTLYTMIAHDWRPGNNSLYNIVANERELSGFREEFFKHTKLLDQSDLSLSDVANIHKQLIPWLAQKESPYISNSEIIIVSDINYGNVLARKHRPTPDEDPNEYNPSIVGNYEKIPSRLNLNYYTSGEALDLTRKIEEPRRFKIQTGVNPLTGERTYTQYDGTLEITYGSEKSSSIIFKYKANPLDIEFTELAFTLKQLEFIDENGNEKIPMTTVIDSKSGELIRYPKVKTDEIAKAIRNKLEPKETC